MRAALRPREPRDRLIVALDLDSADAARRMVERLGGAVSFYKLGMQLVFAGGLTLVGDLVQSRKSVFLDMKLLDIGNTIAGAIGGITRLGVTFTTIHAYPDAMRAAAAARPAGGPGLLGVTVLTSMDDGDLRAAGYAKGAVELAADRAIAARAAGMDGVVCSPREAAGIRALVGRDMLIVTPGIRPAESSADDQKRTMTSAQALAEGADYIVVGRPVTAARDPAAAAERIVDEIERAL